MRAGLFVTGNPFAHISSLDLPHNDPTDAEFLELASEDTHQPAVGPRLDDGGRPDLRGDVTSRHLPV